ncbi:hypothetical protein GCM10012278_27710 [Nonomuraea glycinis]|uniref:Uncharacterized protein n=1 Tax=Nonomuraea glycinis TaxID=2047744 RepID=A0A918A3K9_9ACTN|nr:hypothetical protein GCM10012278_27710 [Nonomuraea glycinis]
MPSWNGRALIVPDRPREDSNGGLNTLHAYACPIAKWTDRAAGGISQRLQPGGATVRERSRKAGVNGDRAGEIISPDMPYTVCGEQSAVETEMR